MYTLLLSSTQTLARIPGVAPVRPSEVSEGDMFTGFHRHSSTLDRRYERTIVQEDLGDCVAILLGGQVEREGSVKSRLKGNFNHYRDFVAAIRLIPRGLRPRGLRT